MSSEVPANATEEVSSASPPQPETAETTVEVSKEAEPESQERPSAPVATRHSSRPRKTLRDDDFVQDYDTTLMKRLEKALDKDDKEGIDKALSGLSSNSDRPSKRRKKKQHSDDEGYEVRPRGQPQKRKPAPITAVSSPAALASTSVEIKTEGGEAAEAAAGAEPGSAPAADAAAAATPAPDSATTPAATPPPTEYVPSRAMTFQEAAVWVMLDQRKKGVLALSAKTTWDCICAYGLNVARSCRTPVQSLSSRMSEDVKKNSDTSVFVRVGDGLYTVRQDHEKFAYEKYLSTKTAPLPILPDKPPPRRFDVGMDESDADETTHDRRDRPRSRPSSRGAPIAAAPEDFLVWAWTKSKRTTPQWAGLPIKIEENGDVQYGGVIMAGENFRIGDCLLLNAEHRNRGQRPVRQIVKMWQPLAADSESKKNVASRMLVQCIRYVYPEDTPDGRSSKHDRHEVFLTDATDVYTIEELGQEIYSLVDILQWPQYREIDMRKVQGDVLVCRAFFSIRTGDLQPLTMSKNGFCELRDRTDDDKSQVKPKHWPDDVLFITSSLLEDQHNMSFTSQRNDAVYLLSLKSGQSDAPTITLCAAKKLQANELIGEYVGRLSRFPKNDPDRGSDEDEDEEEEEDEGEGRAADGGARRPRDKGAFKVTLFEDEIERVVVDAALEGNETRFVQNSRTARLSPNVKFVPMKLGGQWHLLVLAMKEIRSGEVLAADFEAVGQPNKFPSGH